MKLAACLVLSSVLISLGFLLTRNAYLMGALVFVATPLYVVAALDYLSRVFSDLRRKDVL